MCVCVCVCVCGVIVYDIVRMYVYNIHSKVLISSVYIITRILIIILPMSIINTVVCPSLPSDVAGICVEECSSDDDSSGGEICCSNGSVYLESQLDNSSIGSEVTNQHLL